MPFETTTDDVIAGIDLRGSTAVITGATTGLGRETARALASAGARVVICGRSVEKCEASASVIRESVSGADLDTETFDLSDLTTVRAGAERILARYESLQLLVNNAGVMFTPEGRTAQGFETQFGTNHVGHFVLTNLLLPALQAGAPSRIVNLSSAGHGFGDVSWDDPNYERRAYDKFEAYGQSKTANILFTVELDRRHGPSGVRSNAVHPGMIMTELGRHMNKGDMEELGLRRRRRDAAGRGSGSAGGGGSGAGGLPAFKSVQQGAATSVWAAVTPELEDTGGRYLEDVEVSTAARYAMDPDAAARLWAMTEELVGESFPP